MPDSPPLFSFFFGYFYILGPSFWLFVFFYNQVICRLDQSLLKTALNDLNFGFLITMLAAPLVFSDLPLIHQVLTFSPTSAAAAVILLGLGAIWTVGIAFQAAATYRLLRPLPVPQLLWQKSRCEIYHPQASDWDEPQTESYGRGPYPTKPGADPPPPLQSELQPLERRPLSSRLTMTWPLSRINQAHDLRVVEMALAFPNLPPAFDRLRVLHLADLHLGRELSPLYYDKVMEQAIALRPDLAVFTGDLTAHDNLYREGVQFFSPLAPPLGVWAIRGNHDFFNESELISYWFEHDGIGMLSNRSIDLCRGDQVLRLAGTEHPHQRVRDWDDLLAGRMPYAGSVAVPAAEPARPAGESNEIFRLALTHRPDYARPLARAGADLVLAGHTHGGQWRPPLIGPVVMPSFYGRRYALGLYPVGHAALYTSPGFGAHTVPLRFRCPPQITLIELRRKAVSEKPSQG